MLDFNAQARERWEIVENISTYIYFFIDRRRRRCCFCFLLCVCSIDYSLKEYMKYFWCWSLPFLRQIPSSFATLVIFYDGASTTWKFINDRHEILSPYIFFKNFFLLLFHKIDKKNFFFVYKKIKILSCSIDKRLNWSSERFRSALLAQQSSREIWMMWAAVGWSSAQKREYVEKLAWKHLLNSQATKQ